MGFFFMPKKEREDDHKTNTSTDFHFYASELSFFNTNLKLMNASIYLEHIGSENGFNTGLLKYQYKIATIFLSNEIWWRMYVRRRIDGGACVWGG